MPKSILKVTGNSAVVKCSDAGTYTITLDADLLPANQVLDVTPRTVNIAQAKFTGAVGSVVTVVRNGVKILDADPASGAMIDFLDSDFVDTIQNTQDIIVTITGNAQCYLVLRKASGYKNKIEPDQFGSADNPAVSGS